LVGTPDLLRYSAIPDIVEPRSLMLYTSLTTDASDSTTLMTPSEYS
jgi:hypothetical protein